MPDIPIPDGLEGSENLPRTHRELRNCWKNEDGNIISRPGISSLNTTGKVARGAFVWNDALYQVASQDLLKVAKAGTYTSVGNINGPEPIETAIGFNHAAIVARGGSIYSVDRDDVVTDISGNDNFVPCSDVCHINGRFVFIPSNGDPAFFSDVGAVGDVQASSFFDAEELPDRNSACFNHKNTLYILGTDSIELFRDTGATPNPFTRVSGSRILNGYIGGLLEYLDTFLFIGREKDQSPGIYAIGQGGAPQISNERINLILKKYTESELAECISGRLKWNGYDIATFTLRNDSFGFYKGNWFTLDTLQGGSSRAWQAGYIAQFEGEYYTAFEGKIGKFAKVNTDYGERITRIIDIGFDHPERDFFACQSIELGISQGYNSADGSVAIMMSRDGVLHGPPVYRNLGDIGQYESKLRWNPPGGLGMYDGFMGVRIYTTEDVEFSADHLQATFR